MVKHPAGSILSLCNARGYTLDTSWRVLAYHAADHTYTLLSMQSGDKQRVNADELTRYLTTRKLALSGSLHATLLA
jgi:hypothetical protein